jgi:hypothetical protein
MLSVSKRLVGPTSGTVGYKLFWNDLECGTIALFLQNCAYRRMFVLVPCIRFVSQYRVQAGRTGAHTICLPQLRDKRWSTSECK